VIQLIYVPWVQRTTRNGRAGMQGLNHAECSPNHVECSLNHVECSLSHVECSHWRRPCPPNNSAYLLRAPETYTLLVYEQKRVCGQGIQGFECVNGAIASNLKHRPIGIGVRGLADVNMLFSRTFSKLHITPVWNGCSVACRSLGKFNVCAGS
jgi:hypothetical protein